MNYDIVIVGGGLAGASLAVGLRRSALRIAVVEASLPQQCGADAYDQRIYALSPASVAFLEEIGAWAHLDRARVQAVYEMDVRGDANGRLRFDAYRSGLTELAWIVESSAIQRELWESLKRQHNVTLFCPAQGSAIDAREEGIEVRLDDGRILEARLLIGADGVRSWVREQLGLQARVQPYGERGVVANFRSEREHHGVARQWFREDGVLAWLPLPGRRVSMVWSAPDPVADELMGLSKDALCARVAAAGQHVLGKLELISDPAAFPLRLMRVPQSVCARGVLIGDAAHAIHPLSGHGVNLGFKDAESLVKLLGSLPAWRDPGDLSLLRKHARARAEEPMLMQLSTDALDRLFKSPNPLLRALRNHGMNLTGSLPVVRDALVRYATQGRF